jgi:crotonobetainyl-CoA:carnitine CoA-transferase CaiB-like acyl-CoA transferase
MATTNMRSEGKSAPPLTGEIVIDLSVGIAGGYCTRTLADAGALVIKVEVGSGDPLRRWSASGHEIAADSDGALFQYLGASKKSVVVDPKDDNDQRLLVRLLSSAGMIVWSGGSELAAYPDLHPDALRRQDPSGIIVSITPFGLHSSSADEPWTEFTLQALCGGVGERGAFDRPPVSVGGQFGEWLAGMAAATAALASRARLSQEGDLVDVSILESLVFTNTQHPVTWFEMVGTPRHPVRNQFSPGVEATKDGYVTFMVVTGQQWLDFCVLIDQPDWLEDESLIRYDVRMERRGELRPKIAAALRDRTTAEVLDLAVALRVPCAQVVNGKTILEVDHFAERGALVKGPGGFMHPDVPWRSSAFEARRLERAPHLGENTEEIRREIPIRDSKHVGWRPKGVLPFEGLRVADFSQIWAGPLVGQYLAIMGADVIRIESITRIDATRLTGVPSMDIPHWWEYGPYFHGCNTNKRDLGLDVTTDEGREILLRLVSTCDVFVENWTPRVLNNLGLSEEVLREARPDLVILRMPGYGLTGPWANQGAYAPQIEAASGIVWLTGYPDRAPDAPTISCDPIAGTHAAAAVMLGIEHKRLTGEGSVIESPMIAGSMCMAAEQVIEFSAYGAILERDGNRGPTAAPQGIYRTNDVDENGVQDEWVAIAVQSDLQFKGLSSTIGGVLTDSRFDRPAGRRREHDLVDEVLRGWVSQRSADTVVCKLLAAGVPVQRVWMAHRQTSIPALQERGYFEVIDHPVFGQVRIGGLPARFEQGPERLHRTRPPLLGEHSASILAELGFEPQEIERLEKAAVIGDRPVLYG